MKKIIILGLMTIGFTGASLNNKATSVVKIYEKELKDTPTIDTISYKLQKLDSVLVEINKLENEKY